MMNARTIFFAAALSVGLAAGCGDDDPDQVPLDIAVDENSGNSSESGNADAGSNNSLPDDAGIMEDAGTDEDAGQPEEDMAVEEPCGNGVLDEGELCDGDCPDSCDDGNACTEDTLTGSAATCDAECTYAPIAACATFEGDYTGSYFVKAEEKLGTSVINSVSCTGTFDASVDLSRDDVLEGTATCTYPGSLGGFSTNQSATITGSITPEGTVSARIVHDFGTERDGTFRVDGAITNGVLVIDDTGGFRPNSFSAVDWETTIQLNVD